MRGTRVRLASPGNAMMENSIHSNISNYHHHHGPKPKPNVNGAGEEYG
jgi:hypothetical protein